MIFLFIHGGPGLNSTPEKNMLQEDFQRLGYEIFFWNEPSGKKQPVSFKDSCDSLKEQIEALGAKEKITLIAHSFGAYTLNAILPDVEHLLHRLILLSPVTNLNWLDKNLLSTGLKFSPSPEVTLSLNSYLAHMDENAPFDQSRFEALCHAAGNNVLIPHYWHKKELIADYYAHFSDYEFSLENFRSIRLSSPTIGVTNHSEVPTEVIYGAYDPFISPDDYSVLRKVYSHSTMTLLSESSHYGHIEEKSKFFEICLKRTLPTTSQQDIVFTTV